MNNISFNVPPVSAIVPAQNNGGDLITCRGVLRLIFSHFSPRELFRCDAVNTEWRSVANDFLNQLEDPRGIQHPIYTQAEFIEKFRDGLARIQSGGELRPNVAQFRSKNRPCPTLKIIISLSPRSVFVVREPQSQPITIAVILDEVNRKLGDNHCSWSDCSTYGDGYGSALRIDGSEPEGGFVKVRQIIYKDTVHQWRTSSLEAESRECKVAAIATMILVALAALAIFKHFNNS